MNKNPPSFTRGSMSTADGKPYGGTIQIPASVITDSDFISLKLSDYPQQKVTLGFDKIPIGQ